MQLLKRIFFFISLFALYIILRELLELYAYAYTFHPYAGYVVLLLILGTLIYFGFNRRWFSECPVVEPCLLYYRELLYNDLPGKVR